MHKDENRKYITGNKFVLHLFRFCYFPMQIIAVNFKHPQKQKNTLMVLEVVRKLCLL